MKFVYMDDRDKLIVEYINDHYNSIQNMIMDIDSPIELENETDMLKKAILFDLLQIGELIQKLSREIKSLIPINDFKGVIDIRNHIVHGYIALNLEIIWNTILIDLPRLIELINIHSVRVN